jgi:hypothetical protein
VSTDPVRAALPDEMWADAHECGHLRNALLAVLYVCDEWDEDWGQPSEHAAEARAVIARALGMDDPADPSDPETAWCNGRPQ